MSTTHDLLTAANTAQMALRNKRTERDEYISARITKERKLASEAAACVYDADLETLGNAAVAAQDAHRKSLEADTYSGVGAKFEIGTVFIEWVRKYRRFSNSYGTDNPFQKTGNRARYIGRTTDTKLPANAKYGMPALGDYFLQIVKKDDTPGIAFVQYHKWGNYYPIGFDPNDVSDKNRDLIAASARRK